MTHGFTKDQAPKNFKPVAELFAAIPDGMAQLDELMQHAVARAGIPQRDIQWLDHQPVTGSMQSSLVQQQLNNMFSSVLVAADGAPAREEDWIVTNPSMGTSQSGENQFIVQAYAHEGVRVDAKRLSHHLAYLDRKTAQPGKAV